LASDVLGRERSSVETKQVRRLCLYVGNAWHSRGRWSGTFVSRGKSRTPRDQAPEGQTARITAPWCDRPHALGPDCGRFWGPC